MHLKSISHPHGTLVQGVQDFSLPQILDCGQCFTFFQLPDGRWQGWAGGHALTVSQPQPDTLLFYRTDAETFRRFWQPYFDLDTDYAAIKAVLAQDETLRRAIQFAPGIRILRQDSWETLCSFIISQNNNIKRIKGIIERLCRLLGQSIGDSGFFSFPTPEALAAATADQLAPLRCGFRARYLIDAAQKVCSGQVRLDAIPSMPLEEARRELIEGNLRLVLSVIQRFAGRGENADDLFQVGCVGLIKAIDNFDINQPVRFSTYGVPMIIGEIRRYLRDNSAIRVSRSMRDTAYKVLQVRDKYLAENQREPTVEQIAQELGIPREEVVFAMDAIVDPVSLYEPVYSDGGDAICVMDQVSDTRNTDEAWTDRIALKEAMKRLDDRERRILSLRFYEGKTQMEVSAEVGISQAQVSRLEKGAINTIKKNI